MHYWLKRTIRLRTDWKAALSCTGSPAWTLWFTGALDIS